MVGTKGLVVSCGACDTPLYLYLNDIALNTPVRGADIQILTENRTAEDGEKVGTCHRCGAVSAFQMRFPDNQPSQIVSMHIMGRGWVDPFDILRAAP